MGHEEHRKDAPSRVAFGVVTVSDTRTLEEDTSGNTVCTLLTEAGHTIAGRVLVRDEPEDIRRAVLDVDGEAVVVTGGTGLSSRDTTPEALEALWEKRMPGFGELFRYLSFREIGTPAMLSRAVAGIIRGRPVFCIPGSPAACRLAVSDIIAPEAGHVLREVRR